MNMMKETKRNYSLQVGGTVYTAVAMILTQILLLIHFKTTESAKNSLALPGCPQSCAGIPIPYPFGMGTSCSFSEEFNISCEISLGTGILLPYLGIYQAIEIRNISLSLGQARISSPIATWCYDSTTKGNQLFDLGKDFTGKPMWLNTEKNIFTVIGCHAFGYLLLDYTTNYSVGCLASCDSLDTINKYGSCSGIGCCQTAISKETVGFLISFDTGYTNSEVYNFSPCSYAMVVEEAEFQFNTTYITTDRLKNYTASMPIVIDWVIKNTTCDIALETKSSHACRSDHSICLTISGRGYLCNCSNGYEGNPYLDGGCQDIDECKSQNACSKPGKCHNFEGGYRCSCPFGWRRNHNNMRDCDLNVALLIAPVSKS